MIIWHAPTEPPKEGSRLIVLCKDGNYETSRDAFCRNGKYYVFEDSSIIHNKDVLAWTEYNMPVWVQNNSNSERKQE